MHWSEDALNIARTYGEHWIGSNLNRVNFNLSWQRKLKDGRKVGHVAPAYVYECKCSGMAKNLQLLLRVTVVQYIIMWCVVWWFLLPRVVQINSFLHLIALDFDSSIDFNLTSSITPKLLVFLIPTSPRASLLLGSLRTLSLVQLYFPLSSMTFPLFFLPTPLFSSLIIRPSL